MSPNRVIPGAPRFLKIFVYLALLAGLVSLPVAVSAALSTNHLADQRNNDRVAADQASCARGNDFRQQVIDIAEAQKTLVHQILAEFIPTDPAQSSKPSVIAAVQRIDQLFVDYQAAVDKIQLTDCNKAIPVSK